MLLMCPQCETQYRLDQALLGGKGRRVRCTTCRYIWFQHPDGEQENVNSRPRDFVSDDIRPDHPHEEENDHHDLTETAHQAALDSEQDMVEHILSEDDNEALPGTALPMDADLMEQLAGHSFADALAAEDAAQHKIPDVVKPKTQGFDIPVAEYRPMGMGAGMFGIFTCLLFAFVTLSLLFVFKKQVVYAAPSTAMLYEAIGMHVKAPGEGLRLSEIQAEHVVERGKKKLALSAKLANMTEGDITHPPLQATLKGPYGAVIDQWDLREEAGKKISAGATVPVNAEFEDVPDGGATIELKVIK